MACTFEPQTWRKEFCVHCFQPRSSHTSFQEDAQPIETVAQKKPLKKNLSMGAIELPSASSSSTSSPAASNAAGASPSASPSPSPAPPALSRSSSVISRPAPPVPPTLTRAASISSPAPSPTSARPPSRPASRPQSTSTPILATLQDLPSTSSSPSPRQSANFDETADADEAETAASTENLEAEVEAAPGPSNRFYFGAAPPPPPPPPAEPTTEVSETESEEAEEGPSSSAPPRGQNIPPPPPPQAAPPSGRSSLLDSIRSGVALRNVEVPQRRQTREELSVGDLSTELQWKLSKRRREKKAELEDGSNAQERIKDLSDRIRAYINRLIFSNQESINRALEEINSLGELVTESTDPHAKFINECLSELKTLQQFSNLAQETLNMSTHVLENQSQIQRRSDWPFIDPQAVKNAVNGLMTRSVELESPNFQATVVKYNFQMDFNSRAYSIAAGLMNLLYGKGFHAYETSNISSLSRFDAKSKVHHIYSLLATCKTTSQQLENSPLRLVLHPRYDEVQQVLDFLFAQYQEDLQVREKKGDWDKKESIQLQSIGSRPVIPGKTHHDFKNQVLSAIQNNSEQQLQEIVDSVSNPQSWKDSRSIFITAALGCKNLRAIQILLTLAEGELQPASSECALWMKEAVKKEFYDAIEYFLGLGFDVDGRNDNSGGNTPLHVAARRSDLKMMAYLIRKGANPSIINSSSRTALQLIAIQDFSKAEERAALSQTFAVDFTKFMNNPTLSDVTLVSNNGTKFYAHKIILCSQSPVFDAMLNNKHWKESTAQEVTLQRVDSKLLKYLLEFLYSGTCLFPRDDILLGIDLLGVAQEYLLSRMMSQVESVLADKITRETVLDMYNASFGAGALWLNVRCAMHLLKDYDQINEEEPDEKIQTLLHLLDNVDPKLVSLATF